MGETGKRSRSQRGDQDRDGRYQKRRDRDQDGDEKYQKRWANNREDKGDDELIVYRILCPDSVIGSVIGKSGKVINSIRQETRSKIKVVDPFPGAKERVLTIYCYVKDKGNVEVDDDDEDMDPLCPAQDALLRVHSAIANALASAGDSDKRWKDKEQAHVLVPTSQAANIIGKSGATIKKMRSKTGANIKVSPKDITDTTHSCAMEFDNFVMITGDTEAVKRALYAVSAIMYKFSPKEDVPLDTTVPEAPPSIIIPSELSIYPGGGFYQTADPAVPPRSVPSFLGATQHLPEFHGYTDTGSTWPAYSSGLPVVSGYGAPSRSEELKIRLLCPLDKIGRVIGKGGSSIKSVRQETGANVEVDDTKEDRDECLITVTSTESPDDLKSMAVEAVLMLQGKINDNDDNDSVSIRLLVPSKVIGCIIGKSGSIINEMRKRTKADVRISKSEKPKCADSRDELVEVVGGVGSVRDALVQIVLRLRDDALKDREGNRNPPPASDSMYPGSGGLSMASVLPSIPPVAPLGYDQRLETGSGLGMLSSSSLYGYGSLPVGENGYGSHSSYSAKPYAGLPPPSTLEILIPANAVGKVMGKGGANIANIRKISGAMIEVLDSKSSRGDRVAQISGTPEEKRSAENLIQAFIMST
ncbi:K Homology domain [Macleaya cordata]|uniref:K Homology domain n=1 Tax=Macleaya cordata TaxID=56857 RepID=A0A200QVA2_MACCD|nr:K Homology domain [Macleaya cordata]